MRFESNHVVIGENIVNSDQRNVYIWGARRGYQEDSQVAYLIAGDYAPMYIHSHMWLIESRFL